MQLFFGVYVYILQSIIIMESESKRFGKENKQKTIHKNCGNKRNDLENSTSIATTSGLERNKAKNFDKKEMNASTSSDDEEDEWEAVEPIHARQNKKTSEKVVEVNLEGKAAEKFKANLMNPLEICSAKKEEERIKWEHWMRLEVERKQRELQEDLHRIHFLAFIAHLRFIVSALVKHRQLLIEKMGTIHGFSTMPTSIVEMEKLLREVFRPNFQNQCELFSSKSPLSWYKDDKTLIDHLCWLIERKGFSNDKEIAMLFFAYCTFLLELPTRICLAFNPMPRLMKLPKYLTEKKASKSKGAAKNSTKIKEKSNVMEEIKKNLIHRMPTRSTAKKQRLTEQEADNIVEEIDENDPSDEEEINDEEESSEEEEQMKKKSSRGRKRKRSAVMKNGGKEKIERDKELDEEKEAQKLNASRVYWNEYWDEREQKWISVDAFFNSVDASTKIEQKFGDKMLYVLAIDNDFGVCEVAGKYLSDFLALETRKLRTDPDWLQQTLNYPFLFVTNTARQQFEDAAILELLRSKPFPQKLAEYKNHPLYALKKDLLKFEAIYPENQVPLGTIAVGRTGNHDIFPRSAVHKLEGSLNWIKESRSIKKGEKPYKIVKARPKTNIPKEKRTPLTLDLYGFWQTEPYVPPQVVDGKIPRNEFGNIYMYKDEMLPNGCVHLRLNGIFNVARRLNLEAVPAVVGWEFSGGINHPILDGCVVLKNDKEVLYSAWSEMARNKAANEAKKNNERVWKNWRRLVRSKLMLEKMRSRFK